MLNRKKKDTLFTDLDESVRCSFKNVTEESAAILQNRIKRFITNDKFDSDGLASCVSNREGTNEMIFTRREVNTIRDHLSEIFTEATASVWFSIDHHPFHGLCHRSLEDNSPSPVGNKETYRAGCHFGSMFSYGQFYSHETNSNKIMDITFERAFQTIERIQIRLNTCQFVVIDIDSIQMGKILINNTTGSSVNLLFPLKYSPKIFETVENEADGKNKTKKRICADFSNAMIQNIALCSDVIFDFSSRDPTIWISFLSQIIRVQEKGHLINFSTFRLLEWEKTRKNHSTPDPFDSRNASFKDRYGLLVLTSLGDVFRDKWALTTDNELKWNEWKPTDRYEICCFVAEQLYKDHCYDLRKAKDDFRQRKNERKVQDKISSIQIDVKPQHRMEIACCSLTPLRIIFKPLEVTTGCRVLRRSDFGGKKNFLLVHFREEDKTNIKVNDASIRRYLKGKMINGISLFDQSFKYFGASTSQMKEYSFWFINKNFQSGDVLQAYNRLGNFQAIKNIATYVARIGQYFSGTIPIDTKLSPYDPRRHSNGNPNDPFYREIPDVEFNGKNFTDGIGKISWGLAGRIALQLNIELFDKEDIPSAFQIRVAGCKGMVAIDPKSSMDEFYIEIRPSMKKFESDDWTLEICEVSRELPLVFNKQVIRLLEDLRNDYSSFETYQKLALANWTLTANNPSLIDIGLNKRIAYLSGKEALVDVKIPIPSKEGRTLFGVVDETDTLEYGQCFIQYSSTDARTLAKRFVVHTGNVIVTKNPCLWPGDVRRLTAVKNDRLKSCMRDVIVFPRKGKRPHPNEMAGSDLDGDQYWVYWGSGFEVRDMIEPLSYESSKKAETASISYEDIIDHIIDQFGDSGIVGQICNLHTLIADKHKDHSLSAECKALAEMFSVAVDAPKTGKTIKPDELKPFRCKYSGSYPRFMWKRFGPFYESQSVTERLFLAGRQYYFEMRENSHQRDVSKQPTGRREPATKEIRDESFRKWLKGQKSEDPRQEKADGGKKVPQRRSDKAGGAKKPSENSSEETDDDKEEKRVRRRTSAARRGAPDKAKFEIGEEKKAPQRRIAKAKGRDDDDDDDEEEKFRRQPSAIPKGRPKKDEKPVLINTDVPSASASSSSSFLSIPPEQNCSNDLIFGVAARIIATSAVKFTNDASPNLIIHLGKTSAEIDRLDDIVDKLVSTFEKSEIFKTKTNCYKAQEHGPLRLVGFYGQIQFVGSTEWPSKYGDVSKLIKSNSDQIVQFVDADLNKLQFDQKNPSAKKKDAIEYEFDCCFRSCPTEIISLFFDSSKNLLKIEISFVWNKCYVRQPNFRVDTMFEIRSTVVHNSDSSAFRFVMEKIFKSQDKIDFLTGRKPNVGIQTNLFKSDVKPLQLKHFEEERSLSTVASSIKSFYRRCEYLPVDQPTNASNRLPRLEFHAEGITKDKDSLKSIFSDALAPVE